MRTVRRIVEMMLATHAALSDVPSGPRRCQAHGIVASVTTTHGAPFCPECVASVACLTDAYRMASRKPSAA